MSMKSKPGEDKNNGGNGWGKVDRVGEIDAGRKATSPTINTRKL